MKKINSLSFLALLCQSMVLLSLAYGQELIRYDSPTCQSYKQKDWNVRQLDCHLDSFKTISPGQEKNLLKIEDVLAGNPMNRDRN